MHWSPAKATPPMASSIPSATRTAAISASSSTAASSALEGRYLLDYYVQLLDGAGINTLDNNQSKDIDARLVLHPLRFLSLGGSYYDGFDRFTGTPTKDQLRTRWGLEADLELNALSVKRRIHPRPGRHH